jgi:hypothetical protein
MLSLIKSLEKCTPGSRSNLTSHQDAEFIDLLPLVMKREQRTYLKILVAQSIAFEI